MKNVVSDVKISNFRDLVNSNSSFVYQIYKDKGGKNHYNLVCSCMDWITVSVRHIDNLPTFDDNIDTKCMQVYSLISSIDLILEATKQLHRVFINEKTVPFEGEKFFFEDRVFSNEDDNTYFKTLRACFGAHPVALNQKSTKRFASWPFESHFNTGDLTVHLYSRNIGEEDLILNLNMDDLLAFLKSRYNYLDIIAEQINCLFSDYQKELSKQLIETKSTPLQQLYVLRSEAKKRLDNDYYGSEIEDLIMIFEAKVTEPSLVSMAERYKNSLLPLIEEIKKNLQEMNIVDLKNDSSLRVCPEISKELSYELSKFFSWIRSNKYDPLLNFYFERFNKFTNGRFNFNDSDEIKLTFLKSKLMLTRQHY